MTLKNNIRNIGIVAHVDAGKTTLTEQLLYHSGSSKTLGSVDKGTTHTDSLAVEKQRGISVKATEVDLQWKDTTIYLIDTPGHIDFSAEVERSSGILDGAIVVLSSVEGVQPQTEVYFKILKALHTPTIFFVNKLDRIGSNPTKTMKDIKKLLSNKLVPLQIVSQTNDEFQVNNLFGELTNTTDVEEITDESYKALLEGIIEVLGDNNEEILEDYLEGTLTIPMIKKEITIQAKQGNIYPVLFGSALKGIGITELLDSIVNYLPGPEDLDDSDLSALVYKTSYHQTLGKIAHLKVFSGKIETRDEIYNVNKDKKEKITIIKKIIKQKPVDIKSATSGELVMVSGVTCSTYDILGSTTHIPQLPSTTTPLLTLKIYPQIEEDYIPLVEALNILQEEDPLLNMIWIKEKKEIQIQIMGKIQLEIIETMLKERFNIAVTFGSPSVIYQETPLSSGYGEERYTMPKPCWAIVKFLIEPLPRGSGLIYESQVRTEKVKLKYQREIKDNLEKILQQGIHGWKVTDLKITFIEGEDHVVHSRPGDFPAATAMALMKGLANIGTNLLEPLIAFKITAPENISGKILNDVIQMRGQFENPTIHNDLFTIEGTLPVATSLDYPATLGIISSGKGVMTTKFAGYQPCPLEMGAERERIGVNPLDRSKYILSVRNAL